jgi:hypothetical protein
MAVFNGFRVRGLGLYQETKSMVFSSTYCALLVNFYTPLGEDSWKARDEEFSFCVSF